MHRNGPGPETRTWRGPHGVGLAGAVVLIVACLVACERKRTPTDKLVTASAAGSGQVLDGMQLDSARRVALQSAKAAMAARNLERLTQLRKWVQGRASVPIFAEDDLAALDVAIQCLERAAPPVDTPAQLERMKTSKLSEPARQLCADNPGK